MGVDKRSVSINVLYFWFNHVRLVAPVETFDIFLNRTDHSWPIMSLFSINIPTTCNLVLSSLSQDCTVMHHLFGNASNVDTCTTKTPSCSNRAWFHKVSHSYLHSGFRCVSCSRESSWTTTNNKEIIVVLCLTVLVYLHKNNYKLINSFLNCSKLKNYLTYLFH